MWDGVGRRDLVTLNVLANLADVSKALACPGGFSHFLFKISNKLGLIFLASDAKPQKP